MTGIRESSMTDDADTFILWIGLAIVAVCAVVLGIHGNRRILRSKKMVRSL